MLCAKLVEKIVGGKMVESRSRLRRPNTHIAN